MWRILPSEKNPENMYSGHDAWGLLTAGDMQWTVSGEDMDDAEAVTLERI